MGIGLVSKLRSSFGVESTGTRSLEAMITPPMADAHDVWDVLGFFYTWRLPSITSLSSRPTLGLRAQT